MERYIRLFQRVCIEKKLSLEDFMPSNLQSASVADELSALIDQGWTVPKLAHELGKSSRQVYRWLEGVKCNGEIRWKIKALFGVEIIYALKNKLPHVINIKK